MKGKWVTYNHSMQMKPTRSHLEGGSPPPSHESPLIPPEPKILPRINYLNWSMHSVINALFHDLVTIKNIPLYGFFKFLDLIQKSLSLSPTTLFRIKDCLYLPQRFYVQWILISHPSDGYPIDWSLSRIMSRSLSWKIHLYPIPYGIWQASLLSWCSTLQVIYFIEIFDNTFAFHITYYIEFLSLGVELFNPQRRVSNLAFLILGLQPLTHKGGYYT